MPFLRSIQTKVVLVIILVLSVSVATSITITVTNQRRAFLDETSRNLAATSEIVNNVVRNAMIVGAAPIALSTMRDLQGIGDFQDITLYRRDGTTAFHDAATINAVNARLGKNEFEVTERVPLGTIAGPEFQEVLRSHTPQQVESMDEQRVDYYFPILNYTECRVCHGTDEFIRGVAHFRVSTTRIFEEISATQTTLTLFFVGTGIVLAAVIVLMMRGIVLSPLLRIRTTVNEVGAGNLDTHVDVRSKDELAELAGSINTMIAGLRDRERLEIANRVIEARNEENRKYLDNINEGLLLLDRSQTISDQYSSFLEELFGTESIAGRSFAEFIYPGDEPQSERRRELEEFVDLVFTSVTTDMEMIASVNPLVDQRIAVQRDGRPSEIVIDASFQRIMGDEGVQNVMAIFVDKTQLVRAEEALERERERSATEQEQIAAILRSGPAAFQEFADDAHRAIGQLEAHANLRVAEATLTSLFRELHSLKGTAGYMELRSFARTLNEVEEIVAAVRDGKRSADDAVSEEMHSLVASLTHGLNDIRRITERFREFASHGGGDDVSSNSIGGLFANLERMTASIAEELGKSVRFVGSSSIEELDVLPRVRNAVIHLVRNAIDHGIEDEIERVSNGKTGEGTVTVRVASEADGAIRVDVQDDGAGIDFDAVAARARSLGLLHDEAPSRNVLLKVLFHPAFTSRDRATEISGRGVGLDAVQDAIHSLGGSIAVATRAGQGTRFSVRIPHKRGEA